MLPIFRKARTFVGRLAGYALFAGLIAILLLAFVFEIGLLSNLSPLQLLTIVLATIFLLRMDVAIANEDLRRKVESDTADVKWAISEASQRIEATEAGISKVIGQQSTNIRLMWETLNSRGELWSLETAIGDLSQLLTNADRDVRLTIKHLGLNMTGAWDDLCPVLRKLVQERPVSLHLLMLGKNASPAVVSSEPQTVALPNDVLQWLELADAKRDQIESELPRIGALAGASRPFVAEVRSYRDLPVVHGVRISGPFDAAYVSFCRWDKEASDPYWWGGKQYHRIVGSDSQEKRDLMKIFDGYFEQWWSANASVASASATAAAPSADSLAERGNPTPDDESG